MCALLVTVHTHTCVCRVHAEYFGVFRQSLWIICVVGKANISIMKCCVWVVIRVLESGQKRSKGPPK